MMRLLIISTTALALLVGCKEWTRSQDDAARSAGSAVGAVFGIPPLITDSVIALALAASHYIAHKNGRRVERNLATAPSDPAVAAVKA